MRLVYTGCPFIWRPVSSWRNSMEAIQTGPGHGLGNQVSGTWNGEPLEGHNAAALAHVAIDCQCVPRPCSARRLPSTNTIWTHPSLKYRIIDTQQLIALPNRHYIANLYSSLACVYWDRERGGNHRKALGEVSGKELPSTAAMLPLPAENQP